MKRSGSYIWVILGIVGIIILVIVCRFLYKRYKLKRALLSGNEGSLEMRYSEYSVS